MSDEQCSGFEARTAEIVPMFSPRWRPSSYAGVATLAIFSSVSRYAFLATGCRSVRIVTRATTRLQAHAPTARRGVARLRAHLCHSSPPARQASVFWIGRRT